MGERGTLNPTLWRTCRAIANRRRLRIIAHLRKHPDQTVCEVADALRFRVALASQYLRTLNSRSLLVAKRVSGNVLYRMSPDIRSPSVGPLLEAFDRVAWNDDGARTVVFKLATTFTHPRRIALYRALLNGPRNVLELQRATRISLRALWRHLAKMKNRGFLVRRGRRYVAIGPEHPVAAALIRLAGEEE